MQGRYKLKVSDFARALGRAADAAEGKHLGHARCVAHLAYRLASDEELPPAVCQNVLLAGLLHDVGWLLVAPEIARAVGPGVSNLLRAHPFEPPIEDAGTQTVVSEHVLAVQGLVASLGLPQDLADTISLMHETWNGSGYPDGLAESGIPDAGLILAVADHAVTLQDARIDSAEVLVEGIEQLRSLGGQRLDPELTNQAVALLEREEGWSEITSVRAFEALADDALYPVYGDFVELSSHVADLFARTLGALADRFHLGVSHHSSKVANLAGAVARELGLAEMEAREIELAGLIAEIGRVGMPFDLVFRPGAYTEDERELLKAYPPIGERILDPLRAAEPIFRAAVTHREKLNGSGYPEGLRSDEIGMGARIIAVADTFIALTEDNTQRSGYSHSVSMSIIHGEATKLFDGLVVDALEVVVRRGMGVVA